MAVRVMLDGAKWLQVSWLERRKGRLTAPSDARACRLQVAHPQAIGWSPLPCPDDDDGLRLPAFSKARSGGTGKRLPRLTPTASDVELDVIGLRLNHSQKAMAVTSATPDRKLAASLS